MKKYVNVVECAIKHENRYLIIKRPEGIHAGGMLAFPGGKVEEIDENSEWDMLRAAAFREVQEEVGLKLQDELKYVTSNYFVDSFGTHVIDTVFCCEIIETILDIKASEKEVADYFWMTREEIDVYDNLSPWMKKYFEYIDLIEIGGQ